nr:HNH endonuclease [Acetobacter sp. P5B1]
MKLMNLRVHDPKYGHLAGLKAGSKLEAEVWNNFWNCPDYLIETAAAIRSAIASLSRDVSGKLDGLPIDELEGAEAVEGRLLTAVHSRRERSWEIVKNKKDDVLAKKGCLVCEACGFDFVKRYGERGVGFIECHHIKPLAELSGEIKTQLSDLALLCANCHRMIHAKRPWLTIEELRRILR